MRYHKKSTIITTNLEYSQWHDVFKNKDLVDAMLDRFKHYCTTIYIEGTSLRVPQTAETRSTNQQQQDKSDKKQPIHESGETV